MADVRDLFYHGVRQQVRRVLEAMGPERVEQGLTAFETGHSSWSQCFFARAYPELQLHSKHPDRFGNTGPEWKIAAALDMGTNRVPMRIVYSLFDGFGGQHTMTKDDLRKYIRGFLDEIRDPEVDKAINALIDSTNLTTAHEQEVWKAESCAG